MGTTFADVIESLRMREVFGENFAAPWIDLYLPRDLVPGSLEA